MPTRSVLIGSLGVHVTEERLDMARPGFVITYRAAQDSDTRFRIKIDGIAKYSGDDGYTRFDFYYKRNKKATEVSLLSVERLCGWAEWTYRLLDKASDYQAGILIRGERHLSPGLQLEPIEPERRDLTVEVSGATPLPYPVREIRWSLFGIAYDKSYVLALLRADEMTWTLRGETIDPDSLDAALRRS